MNRIIKLLDLLIFSDLLNTDLMSAQADDEEAIVQEVLGSVFGPGSNRELSDRVQKSARFIIAQNTANQDVVPTPVAATLVFNKGFSSTELEALVVKYPIEIASAQAKVPSNDQAAIVTLSIGTAVLLLLKTLLPLSTRLDMAIGKQQLMSTGAVPIDPGRKSSFCNMASASDCYFYRVDVIGTADVFAKMLNDPKVAAISIDNSGSTLSKYQFLKNRLSQMAPLSKGDEALFGIDAG